MSQDLNTATSRRREVTLTSYLHGEQPLFSAGHNNYIHTHTHTFICSALSAVVPVNLISIDEHLF